MTKTRTFVLRRVTRTIADDLTKDEADSIQQRACGLQFGEIAIEYDLARDCYIAAQLFTLVEDEG